jgi:hypothetical protein
VKSAPREAKTATAIFIAMAAGFFAGRWSEQFRSPAFFLTALLCIVAVLTALLIRLLGLQSARSSFAAHPACQMVTILDHKFSA